MDSMSLRRTFLMLDTSTSMMSTRPPSSFLIAAAALAALEERRAGNVLPHKTIGAHFVVERESIPDLAEEDVSSRIRHLPNRALEPAVLCWGEREVVMCRRRGFARRLGQRWSVRRPSGVRTRHVISNCSRAAKRAARLRHKRVRNRAVALEVLLCPHLAERRAKQCGKEALRDA